MIDDGTGDDDFRPPQTDAFNLSPFVDGQARQLLGDSRHLRAGDDRALAASVLPKMAGGGGKRRGGSGRGNHILDFGGDHARCDAVDFAGDEALQPFEFALARRIVAEEFIGETDRAQRQTHGVANVTTAGNRQFAASASQINHQRGRTIDTKVGDQSQVNQASFFQSGDDFDLPPGGRPNPLQKSLRIAGIAQCAGGDYAHWIGDYLLRGPMKAAQDLDGFSHRFGSEKAGTKDAFSQTRDFAVFVDGTKTSAREARDLQPNGIGTDINRGKGWHEARPTVYMRTATRSSGLICEQGRLHLVVGDGELVALFGSLSPG